MTLSDVLELFKLSDSISEQLLIILAVVSIVVARRCNRRVHVLQLLEFSLKFFYPNRKQLGAIG